MRVIHACGMPDVAADMVFAPGAAEAGAAALAAGAPIFCDAQMVAHGVTRARLPANNEVICTLSDPSVPALAKARGMTRSAVAVDLWRERLGGAVVAIGNAPTTLFRLLEILAEGAALPACIVGMPVGFVGAAEFERGADRFSRQPAYCGAGTARRQRDGGGGGQCACQREGVKSWPVDFMASAWGRATPNFSPSRPCG